MEVTETTGSQNGISIQNDSKLTLQWSRSFKQTLKLENRIKILEIEKQKKIKDIQKKLEQHKKNMELKILKYEHHQAIENMYQQQKINISSHLNKSQVEKKKRNTNIKNLITELKQTKNQEFWHVKKEREQNEKKIHEEKNKDIHQKIKKRNRVRLMEIQAKQNVVNSWNQRLKEMKEGRQKIMGKKMKEQQQNAQQISMMTKKQKKILQEIYKAEDMETEINQVIENENKMNGLQLSQLYTRKQ